MIAFVRAMWNVSSQFSIHWNYKENNPLSQHTGTVVDTIKITELEAREGIDALIERYFPADVRQFGDVGA